MAVVDPGSGVPRAVGTIGEDLAVEGPAMLDLPHLRPAQLRPSRGRTSLSAARRLYNALGTPRPERTDMLCAIEVLEREPLASAGEFPGDLLRRLIDLPAGVWAREHDLHPRYREIVRTAALARRRLPEKERGAFWSSLPDRLEDP